jgi:hypothetical protein
VSYETAAILILVNHYGQSGDKPEMAEEREAKPTTAAEMALVNFIFVIIGLD